MKYISIICSCIQLYNIYNYIIRPDALRPDGMTTVTLQLIYQRVSSSNVLISLCEHDDIYKMNVVFRYTGMM